MQDAIKMSLHAATDNAFTNQRDVMKGMIVVMVVMSLIVVRSEH